MRSGFIISFDEILDKKYGKKGSVRRDSFEVGYETFKLGVMIEEARKKLNLTQEELAARCGTNKSYISHIENDASDIRFSTLTKIITLGLGGKVKISVVI